MKTYLFLSFKAEKIDFCNFFFLELVQLFAHMEIVGVSHRRDAVKVDFCLGMVRVVGGG